MFLTLNPSHIIEKMLETFIEGKPGNSRHYKI